jgi:hypothetical protein
MCKASLQLKLKFCFWVCTVVLFFNSQHIHSNAIPTIESDIIVASGRDLRHGFISLTINYLFPLIFSIGMSCSYLWFEHECWSIAFLLAWESTISRYCPYLIWLCWLVLWWCGSILFWVSCCIVLYWF